MSSESSGIKRSERRAQNLSRSDTLPRATARARKEPTGSNPQAGSCQTAKDDYGKPGVRFLARSKRGTRFRTAPLLGGTRQSRRRFCSPWVGRDQGRRHCRWRSPDDRNWLSFHDRYHETSTRDLPERCPRKVVAPVGLPSSDGTSMTVVSNMSPLHYLILILIDCDRTLPLLYAQVFTSPAVRLLAAAKN